MSANSLGRPVERPLPTAEQCSRYGLDEWTATADDLDAAVLAGPRSESIAGTPWNSAVPEGEEEEDVSSWVPERLGAYLDGSLVPAVPALLSREDGQALFYPGKLHTLQGESESGKTWLALHAAAQVLNGGGRVVYIDYEDSAQTLVERLLALGVGKLSIGTQCLYLSPTGWDLMAMDFHKQVLPGVALVVVDGVTEAMASMALDPLDASDVAHWARRLRTFASAGCAVVQIDHVTKSAEGRGRYALGSVHKLNSVDGAAYIVKGIKPFGRGMTGLSRISVAKDRPGAVRGACGGNRVGDLHLASDPDTGAVALRLDPPEVSTTGSGAFRPTTLMERVSAALAAGPSEGLSAHLIEVSVSGKATAVRQAVTALVEEGFVTVEQRGQKKLHSLVRPFEGGQE